MSKIRADHVFTSESVSEGHPDKLCDQISDAILDAYLAADRDSHVAVETLATSDLVVNAGEVKCDRFKDVDTEGIVRKVVGDIGYDREELGFSAASLEYINRLHKQSPDIDQGVSKGKGLHREQGAGDQGMMFGYASNESEQLMPAPIACSHQLLDELQKIRKAGDIPYLRPDSKSQVSIKYRDGKPDHISTIVISHQTDDVDNEVIRGDLVQVAKDVLGSTGLLRDDTRFFINPTGAFVTGGPEGDTGLTGRKIIVDTYGGVGSHGGGAFSGKDPSKVDRSAAYYARYAAKNIVASGLAEKCEIQVAYAIGYAEPLSINIDTYGTGAREDQDIEEVITAGEIFDFHPEAICRNLGLLDPQGWSYLETAAYGHFGRSIFPWEKIDKTADLRSAFTLNR